MQTKLSNAQIAEVLRKLLTEPESGEIEHVDTFMSFLGDITEVVCNYCGGEVLRMTDPTEEAISDIPNNFGCLYSIEVESEEGSIFTMV